MVLPSFPLAAFPSNFLCDDSLPPSPTPPASLGVTILPHAFLTDGGLTAGGFSLRAISLLLVLAEVTALSVGSEKRGCSLAYTAFPASQKLVAGLITSTATSAITAALSAERIRRELANQ